MFALVSSWVTPTSLFLFLNVVIGTIAVTARFASHKNPPHHPENHQHQLARTPSLLERVRSIDLYSYNFSPFYSECGIQTATATETRDPPPPLERAPSWLERLRSIDLYSYKSSPFYSESGTQTATETHDPPPRLERAPSWLERVRSIDLYSYKSSPLYSESGTQTATATETSDPPPRLERAPSWLERVKSIKFSSFHRSDPETEHSAQTDADLVPDMGHVADSGAEQNSKRSKSESSVGPKKRAQEKMKKSASEKAVAAEEEEQEKEREQVERRRPATARIERKVSFGDEGVDAKADDFINKFKQQLRLQRLDSLLRYKEIIKGKQN